MNEIMIILEMASAFIILGLSIDHLNRMSAKTAHSWRASHLGLSIGAIGVILQPVWSPDAPTVPELLLLAGFAVSMLSDRRKKRERWQPRNRVLE